MLKSYWSLILLGFAYFSIVILPYLIFGFGFIYGIISYPDLIDLVFYPLIIGLLLYRVWRCLGVENEVLDYLFTIMFIVHFVGHGFHWAANAIHETIKNVNGASSVALSYAYLLDEVVSHKIMYISLIAMLLLFLFVSQESSVELDRKSIYIGEISAIIFGFSITISFIEGASPYLAIFFGIASFISSLFLGKNIKEIYKRPILRYFFHLATWILFWATLYYILFGGFPQPSEIL